VVATGARRGGEMSSIMYEADTIQTGLARLTEMIVDGDQVGVVQVAERMRMGVEARSSDGHNYLYAAGFQLRLTVEVSGVVTTASRAVTSILPLARDAADPLVRGWLEELFQQAYDSLRAACEQVGKLTGP
jgi:hypothetical protein